MKNLFKLPCALVLFGLLTNACQKDKMLSLNEPSTSLNLSGKYVVPSTPPTGSNQPPRSPKTPPNQRIPNNTPQAPRPERTGTSTFTQPGRNLFGNRVDHNNNVIPPTNIGGYGQNGQVDRNHNHQNNAGHYTPYTPGGGNYSIDLSKL